MQNAENDLERVVAAARGIELSNPERHVLKHQASTSQPTKFGIAALWGLLKIRKPAVN